MPAEGRNCGDRTDPKAQGPCRTAPRTSPDLLTGQWRSDHAERFRRNYHHDRPDSGFAQDLCEQWERRFAPCAVPRRGVGEIRERAAANERVLVTTLTKRLAEDLAGYFVDQGVLCKWMHSELDAFERVELLRDLRLGKFEALVGINLLREGLDLPEVSLVAILDADKEGFLRSETSLMQTIGRAARNINAKVILYGDKVTNSMQKAIDETERRFRQEVVGT